MTVAAVVGEETGRQIIDNAVAGNFETLIIGLRRNIPGNCCEDGEHD